MPDVPDNLRYTPEHEWVRSGGGPNDTTVRVGITDYAQEALGDVVYVQLPDVGESVTKGATIGEIESTKSVSDIYAPLSGTITACNEQLESQPDLINSGPYDDGWILEMELSDTGETDSLLDAAAYGTLSG